VDLLVELTKGAMSIVMFIISIVKQTSTAVKIQTGSQKTTSAALKMGGATLDLYIVVLTNSWESDKSCPRDNFLS